MKSVDNILRCPRCGGRDVRRSQQRGAWDALMQALRRVPQRCRSCQHRFYTYLSRTADEDQEIADDPDQHKASGDHSTTAGQSETR